MINLRDVALPVILIVSTLAPAVRAGGACRNLRRQASVSTRPGSSGSTRPWTGLLNGARVPGAVVIVGRRGAIAHVHVSGRRAVEPQAEPMTRDTVFDMASLTKPVATATSIMILIEEGKIRLEDHVVRYLPELDNHGKGQITIEHLLRHRAGLVPDNPLKDYASGPKEAWNRIAGIDLASPPGERFVYSDIGFLILGKLVERVSGQSLDQFASDRVFKTLGMADAHFRPLLERSGEPRMAVDRIAATERSEPKGPMLRGVVHDPRLWRWWCGGPCRALARPMTWPFWPGASEWRGNRRRPADLGTACRAGDVRRRDNSRRPAPGAGLGHRHQHSSPRGALFGPESLGHTGFTGTSLWMDPETGMFVILLTSRLHPDGKKPSPTALRRQVATLAAAAIVDAPVRSHA